MVTMLRFHTERCGVADALGLSRWSGKEFSPGPILPYIDEPILCKVPLLPQEYLLWDGTV